MRKIKEPKMAKIGIYTMGLKCYWGQFEGLRERLLAYGRYIAKRVEELGVKVYFYGLLSFLIYSRRHELIMKKQQLGNGWLIAGPARFRSLRTRFTGQVYVSRLSMACLVWKNPLLFP